MLLIILLIINFSVLADKNISAIHKSGINAALQSVPIEQLKSSAAKSHLSPKIVGGIIARRGEFPEFVQLFIEGEVIGLDPNFVYPWCGGSLISSNKVLTAAHCTKNIGVSNFYALPNFYSFNDSISFNNLIPLIAKQEHPDFDQGTQFNNDVSVLTLSRSSNAKKAKLFVGNHQLTGFAATVIGTGVLTEGGEFPATLQKVTVPIVSNDICAVSYGPTSITDVMLCAGLTGGGKDSCQGDSGGPLWIDYEGEKTQAGIVSWGNGCATPNFYGVYARTSGLIEFILQHAPQAQIVVGNVANMIPVLDLLLLNNSKYAPPPPKDPRLHCRRPRPDPCPPEGDTDYFYYYSEQGEPLGEGKTVSIRKNDRVEFGVHKEMINNIQYNFSFLNTSIPGITIIEGWSVRFGAEHNALLVPGKYLMADDYFLYMNDSNKLRFSATVSCTSIIGEFEIFEIEYNSTSGIEKLAVNFKQFCDGSSKALYGYVRYNSDKPMHP